MKAVPAALRGALALLALCALVLSSGKAEAHAVGVSRGEYVVDGATVTATLTFARGDVATLVPTNVVRLIAVRRGAASCAAALGDVQPTEADGLSIRATYACSDATSAVAIDLRALFDELSRGHRHLARVIARGAVARDVVLFQGNASVVAAEATSSAPAAPPSHPAIQLFRMGVEHILTGYDHLLFLLGLILVGGRVRALVRVITAFTLAHALTLAVSVLGLWSPPSSVIEPAIAASIAYVGVENLFVKNAEGRWRITFPFGLIHGFGFAGALRELALPRAEMPLALFSFNVGVEVGQLAVLAVALPVVLWARRRWLEGSRVRIPSLGIAAVGAVWFVARLA